MRVLFVASDPFTLATTRYRCAHFAEALGKGGVDAEVVWVEQAHIRIAHDVVVLHRLGLNAAGTRLRDAARTCGAALVYSTDDLTLEPEYAYHVGLAQPDDPALYRARRADVEAHAAMARTADAVLVSTEFLAGRVRRITDKPVYVVRNFLSDKMMHLSANAAACLPGAACSARRGDRVTLGYLSGSSTHDADLADIAGPLRRVLRRHENANLLLVGQVRLPPGLERLAARIHRHPFVDWSDLPALLAGVDINLAPMDPTRPFNHAKSEVKFLEAAAVRVPTVAGATSGFAEIVLHNEDGFLAENRADWDSLLDRLITEPAERARVAARAHEVVRARATTAANAGQVTALFAAMGARTGKKGSGGRSVAVVRRPFSAAQTIFAAERWFWRHWARTARHIRLMAAEQQRGQRL